MLAGAGLGKPSSPPGAIPQPETRARVISWKPKWHGDRISKAQINWLPRIVGLGVGGTGRLGRYQGPFAKSPPPTPHQFQGPHPSCEIQDARPPDFVPAAGQKVPYVMGAGKKGSPTLYPRNVLFHPCPASTQTWASTQVRGAYSCAGRGTRTAL